TEVDLGDWEYGVTQDPDVHLTTFDIALNDHFLPDLEHGFDARRELARVADDRPLLDAERRIFSRWLDDRGITDRHEGIAATKQGEARNRKSRFLEQTVDDVLSEGDRRRVARRACERNSEQLENRDDCRLERRDTVDALAHVEREIEFSA